MILNVKNRAIGLGCEPFLIAEMSGNHNQSLERALEIVDAAADAGAHALKIQTYTPDTMTLNLKEGSFFIHDPKSLWTGQSLYDLFKKAYTPWEWHGPIFERARERGMIPFSTPFDESAVDFLESLGTEIYKIASFENTDLPLIRKIAGLGKPVIVSTGMANIAEIDEAVRTLRDNGCEKFVLLKCTSAYPASPREINLQTLPHLQNLFQCTVGLSDHTPGIGVALAAVALGASVIEKHFTLNRADGGVDSEFSLEPQEFKSLVEEAKRAWESLGTIHYGATSSEKKSLQYRRSIYISRNIKAGETISKENVRVIRPGDGLAPKFLEMVLGKKMNRDAPMGTPFNWDMIG